MQNQNQQKGENKKVVKQLLLATAFMFGFGYALVPLYNVFCDITGLNGRTSNQAAEVKPADIDKDRWITVEFIGSLNDNMPWTFRPMVSKMKVHPGEPSRVNFYAKNVSSSTIVGNAVPSVSPGKAARYFTKTECFCFTQQELKSGEEKEMPVVFIVDKNIPKRINTVTLSYTFFNSPSAVKAKNAKLSMANE
ncbi:MAG: cytochrome c oxidase assembly protein [Gammaproteobacteria bacterium]|nr:cytochrome c oxidase assembly protein [Gammaproteobacteria bacterium]